MKDLVVNWRLLRAGRTWIRPWQGDSCIQYHILPFLVTPGSSDALAFVVLHRHFADVMLIGHFDSSPTYLVNTQGRPERNVNDQ
jgi:hypothetical protein